MVESETRNRGHLPGKARPRKTSVLLLAIRRRHPFARTESKAAARSGEGKEPYVQDDLHKRREELPVGARQPAPQPAQVLLLGRPAVALADVPVYSAELSATSRLHQAVHEFIAEVLVLPAGFGRCTRNKHGAFVRHWQRVHA